MWSKWRSGGYSEARRPRVQATRRSSDQPPSASRGRGPKFRVGPATRPRSTLCRAGTRGFPSDRRVPTRPRSTALREVRRSACSAIPTLRQFSSGCTSDGVRYLHGHQDRTSQLAFDSCPGRRPAPCGRGPRRVDERLRTSARCRGGRDGPCRSTGVHGRRRCLDRASGTGFRSTKAATKNGQASVELLGARGNLAR